MERILFRTQLLDSNSSSVDLSFSTSGATLWVVCTGVCGTVVVFVRWTLWNRLLLLG